MQNKKQARITALAQEIKTAFAGVPYPGDNKITGKGDIEDEGVSVYFRGMRQEGHSVSNLLYHEVALSYFSPQAFHYFLPAYLVAVLKDPAGADTIRDTLIARFGRGDIKRVIQRFSEAQRQALVHYFEYCGEGDEQLSEDIARVIAKLQAE